MNQESFLASAVTMLRARLASSSEWALKRLSKFLLKKLLGKFLLYDIDSEQVLALLSVRP